MPNLPTVEDLLRELADRAAMLRYTCDSGAVNPNPPDEAVLSGLADAAAEMEAKIRAARRSLSNQALSIEVKPLRSND